MTKAHRDPFRGNGIRVSARMPQEAAPLAYVYAESASPKRNVSVEDHARYIRENRMGRKEREYKGAVNEEKRFVSVDGERLLGKEDIYVTDEFSRSGKGLFFRYTLRERFDARGSKVAVSTSGNQRDRERRFEELSEDEREDLVYLGENIQLFIGEERLDQKDCKIRMERSGEEGFLYEVHIYVASRGTEESSIRVRYRGYKDGRNVERVESVNAAPFFDRVSLNSLGGTSEKRYALEREGEGYALYVASETLIVDETNRPSHRFQYQVEAELSGRLSKSNHMQLNVGFAYVNLTAFGPDVRNLSIVGKRVFGDENSSLPAGLILGNPHPMDNQVGRSSSAYWQIDLDMPEAHYLDYDVIVISGYGRIDMTRHQRMLRAFLEKGGRLVIDNAGEGSSALDFIIAGRQSFIRGINFSQTENASGTKRYEDDMDALKDRYFIMNQPNGLGEVSPQILLGDGESMSEWDVWVTRGESPCLMAGKEGMGDLIISNLGLCKDIAANKPEATQFFSNFLTWCAEERVIRGPVMKSTVHHRDSLFEAEYEKRAGKPYYTDGRSLDDSTQIVARKVLSESVKGSLPMVPMGMDTAIGTYRVKVNAEDEVAIENSGFERTRLDDAGVWEATMMDAVPGWDTVVFAGTATLSVNEGGAYRGEMTASVETTAGQAFWQKPLGRLSNGRYEVEAWMLTEEVSGSGASIGIYRPDGSMLALSTKMNGDRPWTRVRLVVDIEGEGDLFLRAGFVDGNGVGKVLLDHVSMRSLGEVRMTPESDGSMPLFAYATSAMGQGLDVNNLGFDSGRAVIDEPLHPVRFTIRPYVYEWTTVEGVPMYQPRYGASIEHRFEMSASEGTKVLERMSTLLPPLGEGALWADKNNVYYELEVLESEGSEALNLSLYDPEKGRYFYATDGRIVMNHFELFGERLVPLTVLQARSDYRVIRATGREVSIREIASSVIELTAPSAQDAREPWFLRVRNGSFVKNERDGKEMETLAALENAETIFGRMVGDLEYALPEYARQAFHPRHGEQTRNEYAEYVDERLIRVSRRPIVLYEKKVVQKELDASDSLRKRFTDGMGKWKRSSPVEVYVDEGSGLVRRIDGFQVNHELGVVLFEEGQSGVVYVTYEQDNFQVVKRRYANELVEKERLVSGDGLVFQASKGNWLSSPTPVLFNDEGQAFAPESYDIDTETGTVLMRNEILGNVFADYRYFEEEELEVEDVNVMSGEIRLKRDITFKDEVYVRYIHEEPFISYEGFWDESMKRFVRLDLNPTPGHLVTIRNEDNGVVRYEDVPSRQVLNKDIHVYIVPKTERKGNSIRNESECLRHTLSKEEWLAVKAARPEALLLGRVQVREHTTIENVVVMDARRRGGGLREDISLKEVERVAGGHEAFWDMVGFDGDAYFEKGVIVVRVPKKVLKENGGDMQDEEVRLAVKRHLAYGNYVIIEYV